jgi:hypothetical protein
MPSLEEAPSKNIFQIEVMGEKNSWEVVGYFLSFRRGSGELVSCSRLEPKSVSREKIGWLVILASSLII